MNGQLNKNLSKVKNRKFCDILRLTVFIKAEAYTNGKRAGK